MYVMFHPHNIMILPPPACRATASQEHLKMCVHTHTVAETVDQEFSHGENSLHLSAYIFIFGTDITYSSGHYFHLDPL